MSKFGSEMIERQMAALKKIKNRQVSAGWFESARYDTQSSAGPSVGVAVARIARLLNYGGVIDHPGGTKYITDAAQGGKDARMLGTRFVRNDFSGEHKVTKAHQINIPARPFMQYAWQLFNDQKPTFQKKLATKLAKGEISVDQFLGTIGLLLEGCIAKSMKEGNWAPNSASTIRAKGFSKPLINTAHMIQSVSSIVT